MKLTSSEDHCLDIHSPNMNPSQLRATWSQAAPPPPPDPWLGWKRRVGIQGKGSHIGQNCGAGKTWVIAGMMAPFVGKLPRSVEASSICHYSAINLMLLLDFWSHNLLYFFCCCCFFPSFSHSEKRQVRWRYRYVSVE